MAKGKGNGAGRPFSITPEKLTQLEYAFSCNCNITEACLHAGISTKTVERHIERHPEFSQRISELRSNPRMTAKLNVKDKLLDGDADMSKWVLNHTDPDYKPKSKVESEVNISAQDELILALAERRRDREGKETNNDD